MRTLFFLYDQIPQNSNADGQALNDALSCTFPASDPSLLRFTFLHHSIHVDRHQPTLEIPWPQGHGSCCSDPRPPIQPYSKKE
jgi:hypothetical protein